MNENEQIQKKLEVYRQKLPEAMDDWPLKIQKAYKCIIVYLFDLCLSISWMKKICYINGHNFAAKFRHYTGMSPIAFINYHRIEAAKLLMSDSSFQDISISDIAVAVGYSSISAFSKSFKKHTEINPAQWRKETMKH